MTATFQRKLPKKPDVLSFHEAMMPRKSVGVQSFFVWGLGLLFTLFQFFVQLSAGQMVDGLMNDFHLTALGAGFLVSAYYYVYVSLQTPAGIMMDRYGPRLLLSIGALILSMSIFVFALTKLVWIAFLARMFMGLGAAFAFVGSMNLADKWFPRRWFPVLAAFVEAAGMFGTLVGVLLLALVIQEVGWRNCMLFVGVVGLVIFLAIAIFVRDAPSNRSASLRRSGAKKRRILPGFLVLMRMRSAWINGAYIGLMFTIVTVFASLWCVPFLQVAHHLSLVKATFCTSLIYVGVGGIGPFVGAIDNIIKHRRFLMSGSAAGTLILISFVIFWTSMPVWLLSIFTFMIGAVSSGYVLSFTVANEIAALRIRSASIGFVNTLCVGTAPLLQPLIGLILFILAKRDHPIDISHYTASEYQLALLVIPLCLALAAWLGLYIPSRAEVRSGH